jgi:hypothetical protein
MRELRLVLLGLAAIIALLLGAGFLSRAFKGPTTPASDTAQVESPIAAPSSSPPAPALAAAREALERAIADSPDYTRFFDRLRLVFPGDYETIMNSLAEANEAKDGQTKEINDDLVMADAVVALRHARGALAAKAPEPALAQIFALQLAEMRALEQRDPHLCVAFLYGANGAGFLAFAADHRPLVADAAIAGLDAMNGGRMERVDRDTPSDADFQSLDRALVGKGLTRPEIDALLDGKTADPPIADDAMCKAGETYLDTLATLPSDVRARLYGLAVDLMAKS